MEKSKIVDIIEEFCPSSLAESWDNCGFQIKGESSEVNKVLIALEVTDEVIDEAIQNDADLILTHHPLIFGKIANVKADDLIGGYIFKLIKHNIDVFSCHTNFDKTEGGNNDYIGNLLELNNLRAFKNDNGYCKVGDTPFEVTFAEVIHKVSDVFGIDERHFRSVGDKKKVINTIGFCSGAGAEFMDDAYNEGCDLYITGDMKYHDAQRAKEIGLCVLDAGHYGTEKIFVENMSDILRMKIDELNENYCDFDEKNNIEIMESIVDINPFI